MKRLFVTAIILLRFIVAAYCQNDSLSLSHDLHEIEVVTAGSKLLNSAEIGVENIRIKEMTKLPSLFGERDVIRSLQLLPGVKAESDGSSGFQVRGGKAGQNHILLDDATVYNAGHMMGLFSTFNDAVLASADLYKGIPPAQFGGGSSSVLNVISKRGSQDFELAGTVGLLSAKLSAGFPIGKKVTVFLAARRTYFDLFLKLVKKYRGTKMNFYDLNGQVCYDIDSRNRIQASFFRGRDNMGLDDLMNTGWDNTLGNVNYWHEFSDSHNMTTSVFLSSYGFDADADMLDISNTYNTSIKHAGLKQTFKWTPSASFSLNYGLQTKLNNLVSLEILTQGLNRKEERNAWENDVWASAEWNPSERFALIAGFRMNMFSVLGGSPYYELDSDGNIVKTYNYNKGEFVKTHFTAEPRISANFKITSSSSIKAGYAITGQNIRPLYNNGMSMFFNRYTMTSNLIKPEVAQQVSLGFVKTIKGGQYEFSAEGYFKDMNNVLDYKDGKNFNSEIEAERIILSGKGRSYGLEVLARKKTGKFSGWVGYTLSWTENKINGINNGNWYTASNDRRHDVSVVGLYELNDRWQLSASWVFLSGQAMSVPSAKYEINGQTIYHYSERNGYRAPAYHRLDISASYKRKHVTKRGRKWSDEWSFGIYNVYNRYNPYTITFKTNSIYPTGTKATLTALFGILPSVSYNFYF